MTTKENLAQWQAIEVANKKTKNKSNIFFIV
jgi:hypothetical protein